MSVHVGKMSPLTCSHPRNTAPELDPRVKDRLTPRFWVITCISNPARYKTRHALYRTFRKHVLEDLGAGLLTVECALNDLDFQVTPSQCPCPCDDGNVNDVAVRGTHHNGTPFIDVRVRNRSWVWLKESLWNVGINHLPHDCEFVMFCDADIHFDNPHIVHETIVALQTHKVVQPWYHCLDLGPRDEVLQFHQSFLSCHVEGLEWKLAKCIDKHGKPYYTQKGKGGGPNLWHPGYCVAWRMSALRKMQLLDVGVLGAGDHHMMGALIGKFEFTLPNRINPNYRKAVEKWQQRANDVVRRDVGFVDGTIRHFWHGPKAKRNYIGRWDVLVKNGFDPDEDVFRNEFGVLEIEADRVALRDDIRRYLTSRSEDSIDK